MRVLSMAQIVLVSLLLSNCELTGSSDDGSAGIVWKRMSEDLRLSNLSADSDGIIFGLSSRPNPDANREEHVIVLSADDGETWSDLLTITENIHNLSILLSVSSSGTIFVIASPVLTETNPRHNTGRFYRSRNHGTDWEPVQGLPWEGVGFATSMAVSRDGTVYVGTGGNPGVQAVYRSDDEGETWIQTALRSDSLGAIFAPLYEGSDGVLFVVANNEYLLRSQDRGRTWAPASIPWTATVRPPALEAKLWVSPSNTLYTVGSDESASLFFRSTDLGSTWQQVSLGVGFNDLVFPEPEVLVASGVIGEQGVFISLDRGEQWEPIYEGFPVTSTGALRGDVGELFVDSEGYVYALHHVARPLGSLYKTEKTVRR